MKFTGVSHKISRRAMEARWVVRLEKRLANETNIGSTPSEYRISIFKARIIPFTSLKLSLFPYY